MVECQVLASRLTGTETRKVILAQSQNLFFVFWVFFDSDSEVCTKKDSEAKPVLQGRNSL